jgi:hypothetical protein
MNDIEYLNVRAHENDSSYDILIKEVHNVSEKASVLWSILVLHNI